MSVPATETDDAAAAPAVLRAFWPGALLLAALALAAFAPALRSDFSLWDDPQTIAANPALAPPTWAGLAARWSGPYMHIYSPLAHTAWTAIAWLAYDAGAARPLPPWPFKLMSVATHAAASAVVYAVARRAAGGPRWTALAGAAAFCVHPIQVEAVAWASGLKDVLYGLFAAVTILLYLGDRRDPARLGGGRMLAAIVAMALAALSKPTAMVVPAMLVVADVLWLRRPAREAWPRLAPFVVVALATAVAARAMQPPAPAGAGAAAPARLLLVGRSYAWYLDALVAPVGLAFDYGLTPAAILADHARLALGLLPIAAGAAAWLLRRRWPMLGVGLMLAAIPLAPVSGVVAFDFSIYSLVADHYAYLPMLGVAVAIAGLPAGGRAVRRVAPAAAAAAVAAWAALACRQAATWHDAASVARRSLAVNPRSHASLNQLGNLALLAGHPERAEALQRESLAVEPHNAPALASLGELARRRGDAAAAIAWYRRSLAENPFEVRAWYAIAELEWHRGEPAAAFEAMRRGLAIDPDAATARRGFDGLRATVPASAPATRPTVPNP